LNNSTFRIFRENTWLILVTDKRMETAGKAELENERLLA
jgi:hypothetical protein